MHPSDIDMPAKTTLGLRGTHRPVAAYLLTVLVGYGAYLIADLVMLAAALVFSDASGQRLTTLLIRGLTASMIGPALAVFVVISLCLPVAILLWRKTGQQHRATWLLWGACVGIYLTLVESFADIFPPFGALSMPEAGVAQITVWFVLVVWVFPMSLAGVLVLIKPVRTMGVNS
jgi:hypothetical protein